MYMSKDVDVFLLSLYFVFLQMIVFYVLCCINDNFYLPDKIYKEGWKVAFNFSVYSSFLIFLMAFFSKFLTFFLTFWMNI